MSLIDFESAKKLQNDRDFLREARENILEKAKSKYEKEKRKENKAAASGEKEWMLSSIDDQISGKKKKKSKQSKKKHKKDKKKKYDTDSSSESSEEDLWVEKKTQHEQTEKKEEKPLVLDACPKSDEAPQRDSWMEMTSVFQTFTRDELRQKEGTSRVLKKQEEKRKKQEAEKPGSYHRELNPYYKSGGDGLPSEPAKSEPVVSTYDAEWLRKALKRAEEQAEADGKSLEEVAAQRWGSLEKFYELLDAAEKSSGSLWGRKNERPHGDRRRRSRSRDRYNKRPRSFDRRHADQSNHSNRPSQSKMRKPDDVEDNSDRRNKSHLKKPNMDNEEKIFQPKMDYRNMTRQSWKKDCQRNQPVPPKESHPPMQVDPQPTTASVSSLQEPPVEVKPTVLNDQELNRLAAKLTKAELLGNEELMGKLQIKLDAAREARKNAEASGCVDAKGHSNKEERVVHLTRTLESGYTMPVSTEDGVQNVNKKKKYNKALIEFEDRYNLKQMFETEKNTSAAEQIEMAERAALKIGATNDGDYDDDTGNLQAVNKESLVMKHKQQARALKEYHATERTLESCNRCVGNKEMDKHLMVALGSKCYVSLPANQSLTEGQCCIVPIHHVQSSLLADEDLWQEIQLFRAALVAMYSARGDDCVFFESYIKHRHTIPHMVLHCVPLPKELGDLAPIYFKKAIDDCEMEWAQNKKLVDLQKRGGIRRGVPVGLSYFYADFGMSHGYAHVIEDETTFPKTFAQEIVGGMLDVEPHLWRKPARQSFDVQRQNVLKFARDFKPFDPTLDASNSDS